MADPIPPSSFSSSVKGKNRDPRLLDPIISALRLKYQDSSTQVRDPLQFCADYFNARLANERRSSLREHHRHQLPHQQPRLTDLFAQEAEQSLYSPRTIPPEKTLPRMAASESPFGNFGGFNPTGGAPESNSHVPNNYHLNRRTSVSAESLTPTSAGDDNWKPPSHPKAADQLERIKKAALNNFLFAHLPEEQFDTVVDALQERDIPSKSIKVISQGDVGDYFYIVESGAFDIYVNPSGNIEAGPDGLGNKVAEIGPGGSFGELALMYNAPRAATVISTEKSTLWMLDRVTFRRILMDGAFAKRRMYESFLSEVPLLATLKPYEKSKIADALETVSFKAGDVIIKEGEPGENFYLLEDGAAEVFKSGTEQSVKTYGKGDYFGELALLNNAPRAASVIAKSETAKVAKLGKDGFTRLLGSLEGIMRRQDYSQEDVDPLHTG
jgi:cAMP-dependent protein kinase regulator